MTNYTLTLSGFQCVPALYVSRAPPASWAAYRGAALSAITPSPPLLATPGRPHPLAYRSCPAAPHLTPVYRCAPLHRLPACCLGLLAAETDRWQTRVLLCRPVLCTRRVGWRLADARRRLSEVAVDIVRHPSTDIRHMSSVICRLSPVVHHPSVIHPSSVRPSSVVRRPSSVVRRPSSVVRRLSSVVCRPSFVFCAYRPSSIFLARRPSSSAVHRRHHSSALRPSFVVRPIATRSPPPAARVTRVRLSATRRPRPDRGGA